MQTKAPWQELKISSDGTHHVIEEEPAYSARFLSVLKFHKPGLAPVKDGSGAFHINTLGEAAYTERFLQTFGFYEGRAAVQTPSGWCHIFPDGSFLYSHYFAWCGNYQEGCCPVKDIAGAFFHINLEGQRIYSQTLRYAGDFHDGYAVVQTDDGLHTHIDCKGRLLHSEWFVDLDVYHKGFARAKDKEGWFHIDIQGRPAYSQRYKNVEPFYNGIARVETKRGSLLLITEKGEKKETLREDLEDEFHQVSGDLVSYWRFYTLQAALELNLFDHLPKTADRLAKVIDVPESSALKLLLALQELGFIDCLDNHTWICTSKGSFLKADHSYSLKKAGLLWGKEHCTSWQNIVYSLKTGLPAFNKLFGKGWFEWLQDHPDQNQLYHEALSIYAKRDYHKFSSCVDFSSHKSLLDVGGATGALLFDILKQNQHIEGFLLDLPNVIQLLDVPSHLKERITSIGADFFEEWKAPKVESVVLSRVLHDWSDPEALKILNKVHSVLSDNPDNRLYIVEKVQEEKSSHGALLDLNMLIMTGGVERSLKDFESLLKQSGFVLEKIKSLNEVSSVLITKKVFK